MDGQGPPDGPAAERATTFSVEETSTMKRLLALMMVICLAMFVVACGPQADDQPEGDNTETPENGDDTATPDDATDDTADADEGEMEMLDDFSDVTPPSPLQPKDVDIDSVDPLKPVE
jgi:hypothetical protein